MSASQEKRNRAGQRAQGTDKRTKTLTEEEKRSRSFNRNAIIAVVAIVVIVVAALIINSNLFYTKTTAVTIGTTKYSPAEVDVFYRNTFNSVYTSYQSTFGDMISYLIDVNTPLDEQQYSDDQTWADYLYSQTLDNMTQITALYDGAERSGYTLPEEARAEIDSQMSSLSMYAAMYGYSSADHYLSTNYGKGVTAKLYESVLNRMYTAQYYSDSVSDGFTYTEAQKDAYYDEHADELDYVSYKTFLVSVNDDAFADLAEEERQAAAHARAEEIADADSDEAFEANVAAYEEGALTSSMYVTGSNITAYYDYADWLLDPARKTGDTTVSDTDSGAYAILFLERDDNDYQLVSMRHILAQTELNDDGEYTEEADLASRARIADIQAQWETDPTEEHFAELANANSDDPGSNTNGGLYEDIRRRQMVTGINDWLFEDGRQVGDVAQLYGESGDYQGWHLVYFAGRGDVYKDQLSEDALRSQDYESFLDGLTANYSVTEGSGLRYVKLS